MAEEWVTPHGVVNVAMEEVVLFFNNVTIDYGFDALTSGMSKAEAQEALEARGFSPVLAKAFLEQMKQMVNIIWLDGKLSKSGD